MTDTEVLSLSRITPQIAARFLGHSDDFIRDGLIAGVLPFGSAIKTTSGRYKFDIRPEALVTYKHHGTGIDIDALAAKIVELMKET